MFRRLVVLSALAFALALAGPALFSQQTTNTNCSEIGNTINCTSTTTDNSVQQQQMNEAGRQVGNAIGTGLAVAIDSHRMHAYVKKYCPAHPGAYWGWVRRSDGRTIASGYCPTFNQQISEAVNSVTTRHRDYMPVQANSDAMAKYVTDHRFDPRQQKSWERAYNDLRKQGALQLYAR